VPYTVDSGRDDGASRRSRRRETPRDDGAARGRGQKPPRQSGYHLAQKQGRTSPPPLMHRRRTRAPSEREGRAAAPRHHGRLDAASHQNYRRRAPDPRARHLLGRPPAAGKTSMTRFIPGNAHVSGLSIHGEHVGAWRIRRLQTETGGAHEFTQVRPPGG
jgi:hypothetical protein